MSAILGAIDTDQQPPMTLPLRHFVVGLGFLLGGTLIGIANVIDAIPGLGGLVHVHLLLVGWVCITIMGAMTQFVPVWSGVTIHSRRLASAQLVLVTVGLLGFGIGLVRTALVWLVPFGALMLAGFWTFVYNTGRTLAPVDAYDVTERHFLVALGFFVLVTLLGVLLAIDFTTPVFGTVGLARPNVVAMHATIAVFGAVLTTVYGALYQLGTMFTQTELHGIDDLLHPIEELGHPVGVVALAIGRLVDVTFLARGGAVLVLVGALAFGTILARKLIEMQVDRTPMHTRYAIVAPALASWALLTAPAWLRSPTALRYLFGASGTVHLLLIGTIGFVVLGTLYHIVPFIVWVHRYSDRLGYEAVPMIDDLYDDRLAAVDAGLLSAGTLILVGGEWFHLSPVVRAVGGVVVALGIVVFSANMLLVVRTHSPQSLGRILLGSLVTRARTATAADGPGEG